MSSDALFVFHVCLYYAGLPVSGSLAITLCVFVTFTYGVLDQVWYLIVSIPDLCLTSYLDLKKHATMVNR